MGKEQKIRDERREQRDLYTEEVKAERKKMLPIVLVVALVAAGAGWMLAANPFNQNNESTSMENSNNVKATIKTNKGEIKLELYMDAAPKTVENFVKLASEDFYNETKFHRVIPDFMIQGGDPLSKDDDPSNDGTGDPGYKFDDEINPRSLGLSDEQIAELEAAGYTYNYDLNSYKMEPEVIAMANSGPNTNGSQFFIVTYEPQPHLDGRHTVFGHVLEGMDVVRAIEQGDVVESITIESAPKAESQ